MRAYSSAQKRYLAFCDTYNLPPLPVSEQLVCLFSAFLAHQGLRAQTISTYLSGVRHLQVSAGLKAPNRADWPRFQYVLKGIMRSQTSGARRRLPITPFIMRKLQGVWDGSSANPYVGRLLWAACCLGFFGFMRSGEFTCQSADGEPPIPVSAVSVDSHSAPTMVRVFLQKAKTDPFGNGVCIFLGRSGSSLCPVSAILNYLAVRPQGAGPLLIWEDGTPLLREQFVHHVKRALNTAGIDESCYSGHSFRIGAATAAAMAGVPAETIKMLGRWESDAYRLYVRTPRETLAAISSLIA